MLDLDVNEVFREIRSSEDLRKKHLANCTQLIKKYVGNYYRTDLRGKPQPENLIFTYVAHTLPDICFDNPAVTCTAKRIITHDSIARFMEMGLNSWIKEVQLQEQLEMAAVDFLFQFACLKIGIEPRSDFSTGIRAGVEGEFTMDALTPFMVRVPPTNVVIDSQAGHLSQARLIGHQFQRDLSDLQKDERYDAKQIEMLTADDDPAIGRASDERFTPRHRLDVPRERVTLYELYFPEYRKIGTLALYGRGGDGNQAERKAGWVRGPVDYKGPAEGPFCIFGAYVVPDQAYPLPPIAAFAEQAQELNSHAAAAAREAGAGKKIVLVDAEHPDVVNAVQRANNLDVVPIRGLNAQNVLPLELGGASKDRVAYMQLLLERTDRIGGQSEAIRGRAKGGGVTATEATIADSSADARTEFVHLKYRIGVKSALSKVGWFLFHDPSVVMPVSMRDPTTQQPFEGLFLGGIQPGQEDMDWSDIFLDIEPYSMKRVDPALEQQRAQMMIALVTQIAPLIIQFPFVNWPALLDAVGEANNIPDFADRMLNQQGLALISQGGNQVQPPGGMPGAGPGALWSLPQQGVNPALRGAAGGQPMAGAPNHVPGFNVGGPGQSGAPALSRPSPQPSPLQAGQPQLNVAPGQPGGVVPYMARFQDKILAMQALKTGGISPQMPPVGGLTQLPKPAAALGR